MEERRKGKAKDRERSDSRLAIDCQFVSLSSWFLPTIASLKEYLAFQSLEDSLASARNYSKLR